MRLIVPTFILCWSSVNAMVTARLVSSASSSNLSDSCAMADTPKHVLENNDLGFFIMTSNKPAIVKSFQENKFIVIYKGEQYPPVEFATLFCRDHEFVKWIDSTERQIMRELIYKAYNEAKS